LINTWEGGGQGWLRVFKTKPDHGAGGVSKAESFSIEIQKKEGGPLNPLVGQEGPPGCNVLVKRPSRRSTKQSHRNTPGKMTNEGMPG